MSVDLVSQRTGTIAVFGGTSGGNSTQTVTLVGGDTVEAVVLNGVGSSKTATLNLLQGATVLATSDTVTLPASAEDFTLTLSSPLVLPSSGSYSLQIVIAGGFGSWHLHGSTADPYAGGELVGSSGYDLYFAVVGTTYVPPGSEKLRIYKHGSGTYNDITSATVGGFSDLVRTQVHNDAGSLTFTLTGTAPSIFHDWLDEAGAVKYYVDDTLVESYIIDDYTADWGALTCAVRCVGILAIGSSPGMPYASASGGTGMSAVASMRTLFLGHPNSGTHVAPTGWVWDEALSGTAVGLLFEEEWLDTATPREFRTDNIPSGSWKLGPGDAGASVFIGSGTSYVVTGGSESMVWYYDGITSRADMYVQVILAEALGASASAGVVGRYVSATSHYIARFAANSVIFWRRSGSSYVACGSAATISGPVAGDILGFSVIGTALKAYLNGVLVHSATDANITAAGYSGMRGATTGAGQVSFGAFTVTAGTPCANLPGVDRQSDSWLADLIKDACAAAGYTFWFDTAGKLNLEKHRTAVDKTYTVNGTLRGFDTTYSASGIVNSLIIESGTNYWYVTDATSIATYGERMARVVVPGLGTQAAADAYGLAYFAQRAIPRRSANLTIDHDPTLRPGLLVAVTGLDDGRTYQDLIQQITARAGDLWDEVVTGMPPLSL